MPKSRTIKKGLYKRPIAQYDLDGKFIRNWESAADANEYYTGSRAGHVNDCANNRHKTAYGFIWKYAPQTDETLAGEIWKDISGYEGLYQVSNYGRVRNFKRGNILCSAWGGSPESQYLMLHLSKDGKSKPYRVHRLVAETFLPNPDNLPAVNHIDGDKTNNRADNLEFCTAQKNMRHAHDNGLVKCYTKSINQYSLSGDLIKTWPSISDANEYYGGDRSSSNIYNCLKGLANEAYGFKWTYVNKNTLKGNIRPINQYTLDNQFVKRWDCVSDAEKHFTGKRTNTISLCLKGKGKTAYGYKWAYADE